MSEASEPVERLSDWQSAVGRLRLIGLAEGTSFVLLLGVAMPLKYVWGEPMAVKYTGWAHGLLFVLYAVAAALAAARQRWSILRTFVVLGASVIPLGPFLIDPSLRRETPAEAVGDA